MECQRVCERVCVSSCHQYVAACSLDEAVRVWHACSGKLMHEFHPSKQLTTPVTCLQFAHKGYSEVTGGTGSVLSLGTVDGRLVLYDWSAGTIVREWPAAEGNATVAALCWQSRHVLAVLTTDNTLTLWNADTQQLVRSFVVKGNKSLCLLGASLAAVSSQSIEVLKITSSSSNKPVDCGSLVQKFTGHASETTCLVPVHPLQRQKPQYLLSASQNDTFVYIWKVSPSQDRTALSSPVCVLKAVQQVSSAVASHTTVAIVSVVGALRIYATAFDRTGVQKPMDEVGCLTLYSDRRQHRPVPIVRAFDLTSQDVAIAYGVGAILHFERIRLTEVKGSVSLIRARTDVLRGARAPQLTAVVLHRRVTYATPARMLPVTGKRKPGEEDPTISSLPMESLLRATSTVTGAEGAALTLNKKSQAHLLLQSIHSDDAQLLHCVLVISNRDVIQRTVSSLPSSAVVALLTVLHSYLHTHWHRSVSYTLWMKEVIHHHSAFLASLPELAALMRPFLQYCEARRAQLPQLLELKSRLERLSVQLRSRKVVAPPTVDYAPLMVIRDESSDEEGVADAIISTNGTASNTSMEVDSGHEECQQPGDEEGDPSDDVVEDEQSDEDSEDKDSDCEYMDDDDGD